MTRIDRARYLGALAACLLAASVFAPMMSVSLGEDTHWQLFGPPVRLLYLVLAVCATIASLVRAFWVAAFVGAFGFANGLLLLALTYRGLTEAQMQTWVRPGWGFVLILAGGGTLVALPLWARRASRVIDHPPNER